MQEGNIPLKYALHEESVEENKGKEDKKIKPSKKDLVEIASDARETQDFDGQTYVLEKAITADYAIIKAQKADHEGNLVFK